MVKHRPSQDFSTTRINRLLRPLRNRCTSLADYGPVGHSVIRKPQVTYSKVAQPSVQSEVPPLTPLNPPNFLPTYFSPYDVANMELSKRIYSVRDAFKDIVLKTQPYQNRSRIPKLAEICASVIGNFLEFDQGPQEDEDEDSEEQNNVIEEFYESVPSQYRRSTLLSHSLSLILQLCPSYPTLLLCLLDVMLDNNFPLHARIVLDILLGDAFAISGNKPPPITHPAHANFLQELCKNWTSAGFPIASFLNSVCATLESIECQASRSCRAMLKLYHEVCAGDVFALTPLVCQLVEYATGADLALSTNTTTAIKNPLHFWLSTAFATFSSSADSAAVCSVLHFIMSCHTSEFCVALCETSSSIPSTSDITSLVMSLAIQLLYIHESSLSSQDAQEVHTFLLRMAPTTSNFNALIRYIFAPLAMPSAQISDVKATVASYAAFLRYQGLTRLEVAIWSCALQHIEIPEGQFAASNLVALHDYKSELISSVEEAEAGCFGRKKILQSPCTPNTRRPPSSGDWEWSPVIGAWLKKPARTIKRPKLTHSPLRHRMRLEDKKSERPPRLSLRFESVISDALSNRDVLHCRSPKRKKFFDNAEVIPSSDDVLDLFSH